MEKNFCLTSANSHTFSNAYFDLGDYFVFASNDLQKTTGKLDILSSMKQQNNSKPFGNIPKT